MSAAPPLPARHRRTIDTTAAVAVRSAARAGQRRLACDPAGGAGNGATRLARAMPPVLRELADGFRAGTAPPFVVVSGHVIDGDALGPTPDHWRDAPEVTGESGLMDVVVLLYGELLGVPFRWPTQQDGRLIHNVVPIREDTHEQLGSGSAIELTMHTEDAFHEHRADFLILACLRNPSRTPTTIACLDELQLDTADIELLRRPLFTILPDISHSPEHNTTADASFVDIDRRAATPAMAAVLTGTSTAPRLRYDPYYMPRPLIAAEGRAVIDRLGDAVAAATHEVALEPGDVCIIDNHRCVHGRRPFTPRFDGTDRWLKRVNVSVAARPASGPPPD